MCSFVLKTRKKFKKTWYMQIILLFTKSVFQLHNLFKNSCMLMFNNILNSVKIVHCFATCFERSLFSYIFIIQLYNKDIRDKISICMFVVFNSEEMPSLSSGKLPFLPVKNQTNKMTLLTLWNAMKIGRPLNSLCVRVQNLYMKFHHLRRINESIMYIFYHFGLFPLPLLSNTSSNFSFILQYQI